MEKGERNQQTSRAGEHFVAGELNKRGSYAVTFAGNMPKIDIIASNVERTRIVYIQVKTKRSGTWQTSIDLGRKIESKPKDETSFWIFVDLCKYNESPKYWIVPNWWMINNIFEKHQNFLERHGGSRPYAPESKHHAITEKDISEWKDKWDLLGILK